MLEVELLHKGSQQANVVLPREGDLLDASRDGNASRCLGILAQPGFAHINEMDALGNTSLHHAARECSKFLLNIDSKVPFKV
jgi:hypothetical protein